MRTITIRLSEVEAWALDRLAGVNGLSKNKQIVNLIVKAYGEIDEDADIVENELIAIADGQGWAKTAYDNFKPFCAGDDVEVVKKEIVTAIKIIRYVLENECTGVKDEDIAIIEDLRDELLQEYRNL